MSHHASLSRPPSDLIGGTWIALDGAPGPGARVVASRNPANPSHVPWSGVSRLEHVDRAVQAARRALPEWSKPSNRARRFAVLRRFAELSKSRAGALAEIICDEVGKALWESAGEASALASKVEITLDESADGVGLRRVTDFELVGSPTRALRGSFRPHGVMCVLAPFNFPAHLPNGHIVPALAMGNTVILKPSDKTPGVGQVLAELFADALDAEGWGTQGTGGGVFNLVQGGADVAQAMTSHADIDGILFTGSWAVGRRILEANLDHPGRMIALEMGGSNAAVVMEDADLKQAAIEVIRCAFNTAGQRCTCTRRVIVHAPIAGRFIRALTLASKAVVFGPPRDKDVLAGPVITGEARDAVLSFQRRLLGAGAESLVESAPMNVPGAPGGFFVSPGLVRVARFAAIDESDPRAAATRGGWDEEVFGPLLRVSVARDLDDAIAQANATRYGLAASIFTSSDASATRFLHEARAGCVNVNAGTAGASSKLPFGGLGISGNHRPAGSFALDCCAYPVAMMIERSNAAQVAQGMRFDDAWLA